MLLCCFLYAKVFHSKCVPSVLLIVVLKKDIFRFFFFSVLCECLWFCLTFLIVQWKRQMSVLHFNVPAFFMMWKLNSAPAKSQETTLLTIFHRWGITYVLKMKIRSIFRSSVCFIKHSPPHFINSLVNPHSKPSSQIFEVLSEVTFSRKRFCLPGLG